MMEGEPTSLENARADAQGFAELVGRYRPELEAHCFRMLGSLADAQDQAQETLVRAWRNVDGFEGRSSLRAWLYRIATNACLDELRRRPARHLPFSAGAPIAADTPLVAPDGVPYWIDPCPDPIWQATPTRPDSRYDARESVRLAFAAALQELPGLQRAVLILRDVLGWSAAEVAEITDHSVAAVNSALQRARAVVDQRGGLAAGEPGDVRPLLTRYVAAWEDGNIEALVALLRDDAIITMPPWREWLRGPATIGAFLGARMASFGPRRFLPLPCADLGLACYIRAAGSDHFAPHALHVLRVSGGAVAEVHAFLLPDLFARFGLPAQL